MHRHDSRETGHEDPFQRRALELENLEPENNEEFLSEPVAEPRPRAARWLVPLAILVVLAGAAAVFLGVGRWLVVEDPLVHSDAIVVLSGRLPERALEAARLYKGGYADQVWISPPPSPAEELKAMHISYVGEDFYNEKVLIVKGVPPDSIRILDEPDVNTEEEVRQIAATLRSAQLHSVIIVTSKPHTRRVRTIWRKLAGSDLRMIVRYPEDDIYDGARWWRHTRDGLDVMRETLGLLNAWAGFPARPNGN